MAIGFHWQGGWYFQRTTKRPDEKDDGTVRIFHVYRTEMGEEKQDVQIEIDADSWASIIASVSYSGEIGGRWEQAKKFHNEAALPSSI